MAAQTLGPYTLGQPLGTLPFGELIEAAHAARRDPLALLILGDALARDHRLRGLLRLEIARAGGLRHPAIARPVEVGEHDGRLYVVYERPPGEPLNRWIDDGTGLSTETTLTIVRQLADGLDAAHGRRLAHGSIRTSAILTRAGETATLLGIGVLAAIDEAGIADLCRRGLNPAYVAPEQERGRLAVPTADAYALGRLAQVMLERIGDAQADAIAPGVQAVLDRQAGAEPSTRFRTCTALATALADALAPPAMAPDVAVPPSRMEVGPSATALRDTTPPPGTEPRPAPRPPDERLARAETAPTTVERAADDGSAARATKRAEPDRSAWRQYGQSRVRPLGETPAMRAAIRAALAGTRQHLTLVSLLPLFLLLLGVAWRDALPVIFSVVTLVVLRVPAAVVRAASLSKARKEPEIVQALGPVRVVEQRVFGNFPFPRSHHLDIGDVDSMTIGASAFAKIAPFGTAMHVELDAEGNVPAHDAVFDLTALATYSRTGDFLLELSHPSGELIYADPAYAGEDSGE
jgi:hypothetical protein